MEAAREGKEEAGALNQSYYGPSIPPTPPQLPRQKDSSAAGFGRGAGCAPYNLLCAIFKTITIVLIALAIIVVIVWLANQPEALKVYVEDATLRRFDLAGNGTLYYDLAANVSVRNSNKKYDLFYERLEADAYYDGARFSHMPLPTFRQRRKNTTMAYLTFRGQAVVGDSVAATYGTEKSQGFFSISVNFYTKIRLKMILVKSVAYEPDCDCSISLPTPGNATSAAVGFSRTECHAQDFS